MSASNHMAALLPFILGFALVGVALIGGLLTVKHRQNAERRILFSMLLLLWALALGGAIWSGKWWAIGLYAIFGGVVVLRFYRKFVRNAAPTGEVS